MDFEVVFSTVVDFLSLLLQVGAATADEQDNLCTKMGSRSGHIVLFISPDPSTLESYLTILTIAALS